MMLDLMSLVIGLALEFARPQPPLNTFVQYYFNGVLLAQLPEWDKVTYSHALILPLDMLGVRTNILLCTTTPITITDGKVTVPDSCTAIAASAAPSKWVWRTAAETLDPGVWDTSVTDVIWTNYDLVDAAGTVYLAASEPVPRVGR